MFPISSVWSITVRATLSMLKMSASESYEIFVLVFFLILRNRICMHYIIPHEKCSGIRRFNLRSLLIQRRGVGKAAEGRAEVGEARLAVTCFEFRAHLALHLFPVAPERAARTLLKGRYRAEVERREIFRLERERARGDAGDEKRAYRRA